jgi:MFS family permease
MEANIINNQLKE